MRISKTKRALGLQTIYQVVTAAMPLLTAPYLSRKLGADSLGVYSYTLSIANYFVLFAMLGINNYGTRSIAQHSSKKNKAKTVFSEIYTIQVASTLLSLAIYSIPAIVMEEQKALLFQAPWILACLFDVSWYYFGREKYTAAIIKNLIVKIIAIILIFVIVKAPNDVYRYILLMSASTLLGQIALWINIVREKTYKIPKKTSLKKHLKPILSLFVPILAMSIFRLMDKTMLGLFSSRAESGYYYNADKVVNIPLSIIIGLGTVMLPKITSVKHKTGDNTAIELIKKTAGYLMPISIAICFGIASVSNEFVPVFFGDGYEKCITLILVFSAVIIIKTISDIIRTQYMVPFEEEKLLTKSVIIGAIVNLIANIILIIMFNLGALGATIGTLIAEIATCVAEIKYTNKKLRITHELIEAVPFLAIGLLMYFTIRSTLQTIEVPPIVALIIGIIIGLITYTALSVPLIIARRRARYGK